MSATSLDASRRQSDVIALGAHSIIEFNRELPFASSTLLMQPVNLLMAAYT